MATIYLKVVTDRDEGKSMSTDLVADALGFEVEALSLDVEDSQYSVTSVEVVAAPAAGGGGSATGVDAFLTDIVEAFLDAYPLSLDGPPKFDAEKAMPLLEACMRAAGSPATGDAITRTKVRRAKAAAKTAKV